MLNGPELFGKPIDIASINSSITSEITLQLPELFDKKFK